MDADLGTQVEDPALPQLPISPDEEDSGSDDNNKHMFYHQLDDLFGDVFKQKLNHQHVTRLFPS